MGYYTDFQLTMIKNAVDASDVIVKQTELNKDSGYILEMDGQV